MGQILAQHELAHSDRGKAFLAAASRTIASADFGGARCQVASRFTDKDRHRQEPPEQRVAVSAVHVIGQLWRAVAGHTLPRATEKTGDTKAPGRARENRTIKAASGRTGRGIKSAELGG
jgi:hypothetical protein